MGPLLSHPALKSVAFALALTPLFASPASADCKPVKQPGYVIDFPQGADVPVKLYQSNKGGRLGSAMPGAIGDKLELCSDAQGSVVQIRLAPGIDIQFEPGKSKTAGNTYWVRSNQLRIAKATGAGAVTEFICERNQVKTKSAAGAAGNEACAPGK